MLEILKTEEEIEKARNVLKKRELSFLDTRVDYWLRFLRLKKGIKIGNFFKSWDVLKTLKFIEDHVPSNAPILDIGAYTSEILPILKNVGQTNLTGVDFNSMIYDMPFKDEIHYDTGNFYQLSYDDKSFKVITAISVIEHGLDTAKLLKTISRLLTDEGYFIASFDYWPVKIDTEGLMPFNLSWIIFSETEIRQLIATASRYGLVPVGNLNFHAASEVIKWEGKKYTFGWLVLQKTS